ncbi:CesT family type III secretion system chaperone [Herbaspirillum seropedicae]|uniref:CesT family type III secretion system chaperone n=1 Tax=Herbaspirillum seropedicae TaxID=964 RepID=UPI003FCD59D3
MAIKEFYRFIDKLCELARIPHPQSLYERADIEVDEVKFTLVDASGKSGRCMHVYCDFGPLPNGPDRQTVCYRLLDLNLECFANRDPCFSIDTTSNHVVLMDRVPFDAETALETLDMLARLAAQAKQWRSGYFLPNEEAAPGATVKRGGSAAFFKNRSMVDVSAGT